MVVGDIVNGLSTIAFTFQPAASVSVMISQTAPANAEYIYLTDGVDSRIVFYYSDAVGGNVANVKIMINNSIYLKISTGGGGSFSGIQIQ
jgi:hypothetical protein